MSGVNVDAVDPLHNLGVKSDWVQETTLIEIKSVDFVS